MIPKPFDEIELADLEALIGNAREGKTIEFKQQLPARSEPEKVQFLKAAVSFANTSGGDLIIGMTAEGGLAKQLMGLPLSESDEYRLRLEQILASSVEPRLPRYEFKLVACGDGLYALVMRVPRSWLGPHRVTNNNKFYGRNSAGSYELDVQELRSAFVRLETIAERMRGFRIDRVAKIAAGDAPVALLGGGILVLHVVPFSAFDAGSAFALDEAAREPNRFPPLLDSVARRYQTTFDGLLTTSNLDAPPKPQRSYVQVMRSGAVEAVASSLAQGREGNILILPKLQAMIIHYARLYAAGLHALGVEPPMAILASLLEVQGMTLLQDFIPRGAIPEDLPSARLDRSQYSLVETIFEALPPTDKDAAKRLKGTLDHLANAAGWQLYRKP